MPQNIIHGLHDHHTHVSLYAALEGVPDLAPLSAKDGLALLASQDGGKLSLVKGWRSERLPLDKASLSRLPPLIIVNFSLHGFRLSPAALPFAKELWPELAERHGDAAWTEAKLPELFAFYSRVAGLTQPKLASFMAGLSRLGIDSAEDMASAGEDALAVIASSPFSGSVLSWAPPSIYKTLSEAGKARIFGLKLFLDGSLGAKSAAIDRPYRGAPHGPGANGRLLYGERELGDLVASLHGLGKALAVHAIGHRAIEEILSVLERCHGDGLDFPLCRLEHVQFITRSQAVRARNLGIVLSMQPNFNSDSVDYRDRLPSELLAENDPFRMLIDEVGFVPGKDLIFGSDGMPHGLEYARTWSRDPAWPGQALSEAELLSGYGRSEK
jgi:predicted amidohydrolase YtcJ